MDFFGVKEDIVKFVSLQGKLNNAEGFKEYSKISQESDERISKLFVYASMKHDLNQKDNASKLNYARIYSA